MDHASLEVMPMTPAEDEEADVAENNMMDCQEAHAPDNDLLKEKNLAQEDQKLHPRILVQKPRIEARKPKIIGKKQKLVEEIKRLQRWVLNSQYSFALFT